MKAEAQAGVQQECRVAFLHLSRRWQAVAAIAKPFLPAKRFTFFVEEI